MNELIDNLVAEIDESTKCMIDPMTPLRLYGSHDSRYLKGLAAKAKKLGAAVRWFDCLPPNVCSFPYIIDMEHYTHGGTLTAPDRMIYDLDSTFHGNHESSCTAQACLAVLGALTCTEGINICIIGRGHAVKGLADELLRRNATVTVCHSKTKDLLPHTYLADVIINAAPDTHPLSDITKGRGCVVLDVSGSLKAWDGSNIMTYIGAQDIGRLNTSIALNRYANCCF